MNPMMLRLFHAAARAPETGDGGGDDTPSSSRTYTYAEMREVREEAKMWRLRFREVEKTARELEGFKTKAEEADKAREAAVAEAVKAARAEGNQRLLAAELRAAATRAGMVDPEDVKLLDASKVSVGEDGTVKIPDGFFDEVSKAKPYLFKPATGAQTGNTTNPGTPPNPAPSGSKSVKDMSPEELIAFEKSIGLR